MRIQWLINETRLLSSATSKKEIGDIMTFWLRIKFVLDESCIHALFIMPKLVLHNIGDWGPTYRKLSQCSQLSMQRLAWPHGVNMLQMAHPQLCRSRVALKSWSWLHRFIPKASLMLSALVMDIGSACFLFLIWIHRTTQFVFTIECGVVNRIWRRSPISYKHVSLWSLIFDPHLTTNASNMWVWFRKLIK